MPSANVTVTAEFESIAAGSYTVTVNAATGGSATSADGSVSSGGSTTLTATASSGYTFTSWSCTGGGTLSSSTDNPATLSNITADATCTPVFTATSSSSGSRNTTPTTNNSQAANRIVVSRISNPVTPQRGPNQRNTYVGTNSTLTPGNTSNSTSTVQSSASASTAGTGGVVAILTNNSTTSTNGVNVVPTNTTAQTQLVKEDNVPAAVAVDRGSDNRLAVTASNGWTGRLAVAVINQESGQDVESFIEIVVAPTPVSAPSVVINPPANPFTPVINNPNSPSSPNQPAPQSPRVNPGITITWQPPQSEVIGYLVTVNSKVACESETTSCQLNQLIGPKSKVEVVAIGNDDTFSKPTQLPQFNPTRPIPALVVNFAVASPVLSNKFKTDLRNLAKVMNREGFTRVDISGHTDSTGQAVSYDNQRLSDARAKATMDYLKRFVPKLKAATAAFAYEKLISDESTPEGLYSNRRAEVSVW